MILSKAGGSDVRPPAADEHALSLSEHRDWDVTGLTCTADAARLERNLRRTAGVLDAAVNPVSERVYLTFDERRTSERDLRAAIVRFGFGVGS